MKRLKELGKGVAKMTNSTIECGPNGIPNKKLYRMLQQELGKGPFSPITVADAAKVSALGLEDQDLGDCEFFKFLPNVTELFITNCRAEDLSRIGKYAAIDILFVRDMPQEALKGIGQLTTLTCLDLNSLELTDLSFIATLVNLSELDIGNNRITNLQPVAQLRQLQNLEMSNNQIGDLAPLKQLENLVVLKGESNQIKDLTPLKNLQNLTGLELPDNQIFDVSPLEGLGKLNDIALSRNKISNIAPLAKITVLEYLAVEHNQIVDIAAFANHSNLKWLYLSDNDLRDLAPAFTIASLEELSVSKMVIKNSDWLKQGKHKPKIFTEDGLINAAPPRLREVVSNIGSLLCILVFLGGPTAWVMHWLLGIVQKELLNEGFGIFDPQNEIWLWVSAILLAVPVLVSGNLYLIRDIPVAGEKKRLKKRLIFTLTLALLFTMEGLCHFYCIYGNLDDVNSRIVVRRGLFREVAVYKWSEVQSAAVSVVRGFESFAKPVLYADTQLKLEDGSIVKMWLDKELVMQYLAFHNVLTKVIPKGFRREEAKLVSEYFSKNFRFGFGFVIDPGNTVNGIQLKASSVYYNHRYNMVQLQFSFIDTVNDRLNGTLQLLDCKLDSGSDVICNPGTFYQKLKTVTFFAKSEAVHLNQPKIICLRIGSLTCGGKKFNGEWKASFKVTPEEEYAQLNCSNMKLISQKYPIKIEQMKLSSLGVSLNGICDFEREIRNWSPSVEVILTDGRIVKLTRITGGAINNHKVFNYTANGVIDIKKISVVLIDGSAIFMSGKAK
jgi:Leucine-rich repeat (LRR) protein